MATRAETKEYAERGRPPLTLAVLFGETLKAWGAGWVPYTAVSVLFHAPLVVLAYMLLSGDPSRHVTTWTWLQTLIGGLLGAMVSASIVYGVVQRLRGQAPSLTACVNAALSRIVSIIGAAILVFLITLLVAIVLLIVPVIVMVSSGGMGLAAPIVMGVLIGLVVAIVTVRYLVTTPAIVVTGVHATGGMAESVRLTAGYRVTLFAFVFLISLVTAGVHLGLASLLDDFVMQTCVEIGFTAMVSAPLLAAAAAVAYHRLKLRKDGIDLAATAKVFE